MFQFYHKSRSCGHFIICEQRLNGNCCKNYDHYERLVSPVRDRLISWRARHRVFHNKYERPTLTSLMVSVNPKNSGAAPRNYGKMIDHVTPPLSNVAGSYF